MSSRLTRHRYPVFSPTLSAKRGFEEKAGNKADFIFRGQRFDAPLRPRLFRLVDDGKCQLGIEKLMLEEFKRTSLALTDIRPDSNWDWLSLAQHHRLPTRLLDWTYSALAGLWLAVERKALKEGSETRNGVVWLLKTAVDDFIDESTRQSPFDEGNTRIYRPRFVTRRIAAQRGLFTVHRAVKGAGFVALERNKRYRERLVKFVIPADSFSQIRKHLDGCGVNQFSLFPDLDGLCTYLAWRYAKVISTCRILINASEWTIV